MIYAQRCCWSNNVSARVTVFSTGVCPICDKTKTLLDKWGIAFEEARVDMDRATLKRFSQATQGARSVPQILIDEKWIGGFTELTEMHMDGELDELMSA